LISFTASVRLAAADILRVTGAAWVGDEAAEGVDGGVGVAIMEEIGPGFWMGVVAGGGGGVVGPEQPATGMTNRALMSIARIIWLYLILMNSP